MSDVTPAPDPTPAPGDVLAEQGLDSPLPSAPAAAPAETAPSAAAASSDPAPDAATTDGSADPAPPDSPTSADSPPPGEPAPADPAINDAKADYHAADQTPPVADELVVDAAPAPALPDYLNIELAIHANAVGLDLNTVVRDAIDAVNNPPEEPVDHGIDLDLLDAAAAKGIDVNQVLEQAIADADAAPADEGQLVEIQTQAAADLEQHLATDWVGSTSEGPALASSHLAPTTVIIGGPNLRGGQRIMNPDAVQVGDQLISADPLIIWRPDPTV